MIGQMCQYRACGGEGVAVGYPSRTVKDISDGFQAVPPIAQTGNVITETDVYRYEFEETVLRENRDDHLVTSLSIGVEEGNAASMCLNEEFGGFPKSGRGMFAGKGWRSNAQLFLNIWTHVGEVGRLDED